MHVLVVKVFSLLSSLFRTSIKNLCTENQIDYYSYKKIDDDLIDFIRSRKPIWIISSTSTILSKEFLELPLNGVINFHNAPAQLFFRLWDLIAPIAISLALLGLQDITKFKSTKCRGKIL
jgi:hypothetical protein